MQIDTIDRAIINILQAQAKITNVQLAQEINLSPAATLERVRKLEEEGIIKGYHANIAYEKLALPVKAFVRIRLHRLVQYNLNLFREAIIKIPAIIQCEQVVGGETDLFLKIIASDINAYQKIIIEHLHPLECISQIQTFFITTTLKEKIELL